MRKEHPVPGTQQYLHKCVLSFPFKKKKRRRKSVNVTQLFKVRILDINTVNTLEKMFCFVFYQSLLLTCNLSYLTIHLAGDNPGCYCTKNFTSGKYFKSILQFSLSEIIANNRKNAKKFLL